MDKQKLKIDMMIVLDKPVQDTQLSLLQETIYRAIQSIFGDMPVNFSLNERDGEDEIHDYGPI